MNWSMMGLGLGSAVARLRELEFLVHGWSRISRRDPDQELPEVELSDHERNAALEREISRRLTDQ